MTVLNGSPLLLREVAASGDAYQIEKSLRFNDNDSAYLRRDPVKGNQRTYTFSGWLKLGHYGGNRNIFTVSASPGNSSTVVRTEFCFGSDYKIKFGVNSAGSSWKTVQTVGLFRDPTAWYHVVCAVDTIQSIETDRVKIYVNGKKQTLENNYPTQNEATPYNSANAHGLGVYINNLNDYWDGYMSNVEWIDGLQLSAASFGEADSTGVWNPKAFSPRLPNNGTTWSGDLAVNSGGVLSGYPLTLAFDGLTTTDTLTNDNNAILTFTPSSPIPATTLEIQVFESSRNNTESFTIGGEGIVETSLSGNTALTTFQEIPLSGSTITSITVKVKDQKAGIAAIKVDGHILIDGVNQGVDGTRINPNNGVKWSDYVSNHAVSGNMMFDGRHIGGTYAPDNTNPVVLDVTSVGGLTYENTIRAKFAKYGTEDTLEINGTDVTSNLTTGANKWYDISSWFSGKTINTAEWTLYNSSNYISWEGLEIDGHLIIDSAVDNSFHLKFNDTSKNSALGKDTLNGKIEDATGGLPILKTKAGTNDNGIDYGDVKDSGTRTDSDSANLLLAVPFDTTTPTDYHATIKGSGTNRTLTNLITNYATTSDSRFYGASANLDIASNLAVKTSTNASDFEFGTGDFTIEWWAKYPDATSSNGYIASFQKDDYSGNPYPLYIYRSSNNNTQVWTSASQSDVTGWSSAPIGSWNHYALVRSGSGTTWTTYLDGGVQNSWTTDAYNINTVDQLVIGGYEGGSLPMDAFIQDFRVYNKAKYTSNFKTPTRSNFTVNNLIHGTSTGVTTGGAWSTAFKDGSATSYNGADDWVISSGDSASTNGNNNRIYIDTGALGDAYELTCTDTGGANDIYFAHQNSDNPASTSGWDLVQNNNTEIIFTAAGANCDGTMKSHKRYVRLEGAGSGHVTITITGVLGLDEGTSASATDIDSLVDSPTNYGTDTGAGGEVRGNYCTLNGLPIKSTLGGGTLSQGNLQLVTPTNGSGGHAGTIGVSSGKWYYEVEVVAGSPQPNPIIGWAGPGWETAGAGNIGYGAKDYAYRSDSGNKVNNSESGSSYGSAWNTVGKVVGCAFDADNGSMWFHQNGTWEASATKAEIAAGTTTNAAFTSIDMNETYFPAGSDTNTTGTSTLVFNFGQRAWKYPSSVPSGFKALCTQNLADTFSGDELNNPSKYFDVKTYTGTGADHDIKGLNFQPDMVWIKSRENTNGHILYDAVRGATKKIHPHINAVEGTEVNGLKTFNADGFTVGSENWENQSNIDIVSWCWDAGTAVTNYGATDNGADIACAVWKNTTAGFSIVKWTSNAGSSTAFMNHGLGAQPGFVLIKNLTTTSSWIALHDGLGTDSNSVRENHLVLDTNAVMVDKGSEYFERANNNVFGLRHDIISSSSSDEMIAYCWTAIPGYSAFGKYTGSGNADGPFIYLGFKPAFVIFKRIATAESWVMIDNKRSPSNVVDDYLLADTDGAEAGMVAYDFVSNGLKFRAASQNVSSADYLYVAFAEHPQKIARAR